MNAVHLHLPTRVGLALGAGAARGWAHVGVVRALDERRIPVHCVAGTSIGALVGGTVALGKIDLLEAFAAELDWKRIIAFLDVTFPRSGLIEGRRLAEFFRTHLQESAIEDLPLPFCAIATSLATGKEVVLDRGSLTEAIRASVSLPGIFTPLVRDGDHLVDGGLLNPVPVSAVRAMGADFTIAVDINSDAVGWTRRGTPAGVTGAVAGGPGGTGEGGPRPEGGPADAAAGARAGGRRDASGGLARRGGWHGRVRLGSIKFAQLRRWLRPEPAPNIFEVLMTSLHIIEAQVAAVRIEAERPDLVIRPRVGQIRPFDFHRSREAIEAGYRETLRVLSEPTPAVARVLELAARGRD